VEVIGHEDIGIKREMISFAGRLKRLQEGFVIRLSQKDPLAIVTPSYQMIEQPGGVDAGMARHGRRIAELVKLGKSDTYYTPITQV
jgi:hypothetical protein